MRSLFLFILLFISFSVSAEDIDRYRVELILFTQQPVPGEDETWPAVTHQPATAQATSPRLGSALTPVSKKAAEMGAILYTLNRSSLYRPLLHAAWEQPGWAKDAAQPIRIEIPFNANLPVTIFSENAARYFKQPSPLRRITNLPDYLSPEIDRELPPANQLEGTLTIHRARYLHADFDLIYREYVDVEVSRRLMQPADAAFEPIEVVDTVTELIEMPLQQVRRMRSKERHYIDHPRIGALIEITPIETAEPETQQETPNAAIPESN